MTRSPAHALPIDDAAPTRLRWDKPIALPSDLELTSVRFAPPEPAALSETRVQPLRPPPRTSLDNQPFALTRRAPSSEPESAGAASSWFHDDVAVPEESGPRSIADAPPEHVWRDESGPGASPEVLEHAIVTAPAAEARSSPALLAAAMAFAMSLAFAAGFAARLLGYV